MNNFIFIKYSTTKTKNIIKNEKDMKYNLDTKKI